MGLTKWASADGIAMLAVLVSFAAAPAWAAIYENSVNVDTEDDLFDLEQRGDISEETADTLLELIREGVDLNTASREQLYDLPGITYADVNAILQYRQAKGRIEDPTELASAGALTSEQVVQISPFIRLDTTTPLFPISGRIRAASRFTTTDNVPPPALLMTRLKGPENLSAGFMLFTTRRRAGMPVYDEATDALSSDGFHYRPQVPRVFAQWKPGKARIIVGTFTLGFAERLTLDTTRRITPNGFYLTDDFRRANELTRTCKLSSTELLNDPASGCDLSDGKDLYITPDYTWRESFRGAAGSLEDMKLGQEATASVYGFVSYQQRPRYQYELYDKRYCDDPRGESGDCSAPTISLPGSQSRLVYSTLQNVFDELTGGGHLTFKPNQRFTFGVTGFGALPIFYQSPIQLDFQEHSRYPSGGAFGAVGFDAHTSWRGLHFFLEATHNFDRRVGTNGAGGYGVEQRTTFSPQRQEFELSLRFYDQGFGTPFSRPISSPDLLEGQRARNEAGARFRWGARLSKDWELRAQANFWVNPYADGSMPAGIPNLYLRARADFTGWSFLQPALMLDMRNRNLPSSVHGVCSSETIILTEGAPYSCGGDLYKLWVRFDFAPRNKYLSAALQGYVNWKDDIRYKERFRNDLMVWLELRSQPVDFIQLRLRSKYLDEDISDPTYLETSLWNSIEAAWLFAKTRIALRYDLFVWLDQRASTALRIPNPEHRFQLDFRTSF